MKRLPVVSGAKAIRAFQHHGWKVARRKRGSHVVLTKPGVRYPLTVPLHKELDRGLLRDLIRESGLTVEHFRELLR